MKTNIDVIKLGVSTVFNEKVLENVSGAIFFAAGAYLLITEPTYGNVSYALSAVSAVLSAYAVRNTIKIVNQLTLEPR